MANANNNANNENMVMAGRKRRNRVKAASSQDHELGQRSRLQSIKQLSVDRIATLRHRLSEGRKMLRTRSETEDVVPHSRPESLAGQFGDTWFTVHSDFQQHKYILSGNSHTSHLTPHTVWSPRIYYALL